MRWRLRLESRVRITMKIAWFCIPAAVLILISLIGITSANHAHWFTPGVVGSSPPADLKSSPSADPAPVLRFVANPEPMPSIPLRDLDGNTISKAALAGKVVLLGFWATWCTPCRAEIPEMIALQSHYKDQLQIIGVSVDDLPKEALKKFVLKQGMNYPVVMQNDKLVAAYGGVAVLPTTFVVSPEGRVVQKHTGVVTIEEYDLEIRALLKMPVPARIETVADAGQIFAQNATELPGVDMSGLTPAQRKIVLKGMNSEACPCGCKFTIAQCRLNDSKCEISKGLAAKMIADVSNGERPESVNAIAAKD
jgi:thiol-disulfide isomerase/thioredoxin